MRQKAQRRGRELRQDGAESSKARQRAQTRWGRKLKGEAERSDTTRQRLATCDTFLPKVLSKSNIQDPSEIREN